MKMLKFITKKIILPIKKNSNNYSTNNNLNNKLIHVKILSDNSSYRIMNGKYYLVYENDSKVIFKIINGTWPNKISFNVTDFTVFLNYENGENKLIPEFMYERQSYICVGIINCIKLIKRTNILGNDYQFIKMQHLDVDVNQFYKIIGVFLMYENNEIILLEKYNISQLPKSVHLTKHNNNKIIMLIYNEMIKIIHNFNKSINFVGLINNRKIIQCQSDNNNSIYSILKLYFTDPMQKIKVVHSFVDKDIAYTIDVNDLKPKQRNSQIANVQINV